MKKQTKCKNCKKFFFYKKNKKQKYCCKTCYYESITGPVNHCIDCNVEIIKQRKFCDNCMIKNRNTRLKKQSKKALEVKYKNHKYDYKANGYRMIKVEEHPYKNKRGYVYEHRLVMEKNIGRYLTPIEVVHHIDGNKLNNSINNLVLFKTTNEHSRFHMNERWENNK